MNKSRLLGAFCACIFTLSVSSAHAVSYTITDLGALMEDPNSCGWGINNSGQVTGFSSTAGNSEFHAFLYDNGTMQDLGTLVHCYRLHLGWLE